ncbi:MAG: hypothetical protein DRI73_09010 [Bacteroidetes bacterium]|nr:MAG: hypothetical protein DRI73_09010 [Bacteroidota bacterium]
MKIFFYIKEIDRLRGSWLLRSWFFFLFFLLGFVTEAQRTDIIVLKNGDKITGDLKKLDMGSLTIKTNDMGTLLVDWSKVKSIRTTKTYEVKLTSGMIYYASFDTISEPEQIALVTQFAPEYQSFNIDQWMIVSIIRVKDIIWNRFAGKYSLGIGLLKADHQSKFNFGALTSYRSRKYFFELDLNSNRSNTDGGSLNIDQNGKFNAYRFIGGDWIVGSSASLEQNTEMSLDLRVSLSLEGGKYIFQNNLHKLILVGGLQATQEHKADSLSQFNIEALASLRYNIFKFQHPKINIGSSLMIYPSLSDFGRLRSEFNVDVSIELFKDFFFGVDFYFKSDNQTAEGASSIDYNFNTSIGYSF